MKNAVILYTLSFLFLLGVFNEAMAGPGDLLPKPREVKLGKGYFVLEEVAVSAPAGKEEISQFIRENGGKLRDAARLKINLRLVDAIKEATINQQEAYRLRISPTAITIEAVTDRGVFYAIQTLRQLREVSGKKVHFPACEIVDWPAFRIRGFMHDVGRSFIPVAELKQQIALLSHYKINVFHWHLTEDLAWRLESEIFPALNNAANYGRFPEAFYTKDEVRDLVEFSKTHQVMIIPEIDMPGHSAAFTKALGHDMQSKEGMAMLKQLIDEVCELFSDVPYLHIGTDEVEFTNPDFVPEMVEYIRSKGKKVISWSPGWKYQAGEIDMLQMWSYRGRLRAGIAVIDSRFHYINHFDAFADIVSLYNSNIAGVTEGSDEVAGAIVAVWNDRKLNSAEDILNENSFYPAMLALAERSWKGGGEGYFDEVGTLLPAEGSTAFREFADFERRMLFHKAKNFKGLPFPYVKQTQVKWRITDAFPNQGDLMKSFPPEQALKETYTYKGKVYATKKTIGAGIYLRHVWGDLVPTFYEDPKPDHTAYAYTWVFSPVEQEVGCLISFQDYSRSEEDLPPPPRKWDHKESRIWINDKEISPPVWANKHVSKSHEIPLANENFQSRKPIPVTLKKGWNKVLLKIPVGKFQMFETRLVKWMFTMVFVTLDGQQAVNNITYHYKKN
jgi:hypothetical protein